MNEEDIEMEELLAFEAEAEEEARLMAELDEMDELDDYMEELYALPYSEDIDEW